MEANINHIITALADSEYHLHLLANEDRKTVGDIYSAYKAYFDGKPVMPIPSDEYYLMNDNGDIVFIGSLANLSRFVNRNVASTNTNQGGNRMDNMSRAKTEEEVREELLCTVRGIADYWAGLSDKTDKERCDGVAFSILNIFDGCDGGMPAFDLLVAPHPSDKAYHIEGGNNYYEDKMVINDCMLHELYFSQ